MAKDDPKKPPRSVVVPSHPPEDEDEPPLLMSAQFELLRSQELRAAQLRPQPVPPRRSDDPNYHPKTIVRRLRAAPPPDPYRVLNFSRSDDERKRWVPKTRPMARWDDLTGDPDAPAPRFAGPQDEPPPMPSDQDLLLGHRHHRESGLDMNWLFDGAAGDQPADDGTVGRFLVDDDEPQTVGRHLVPDLDPYGPTEAIPSLADQPAPFPATEAIPALSRRSPPPEPGSYDFSGPDDEPGTVGMFLEPDAGPEPGSYDFSGPDDEPGTVGMFLEPDGGPEPGSYHFDDIDDDADAGTVGSYLEPDDEEFDFEIPDDEPPPALAGFDFGAPDADDGTISVLLEPDDDAPAVGQASFADAGDSGTLGLFLEPQDGLDRVDFAAAPDPRTVGAWLEPDEPALPGPIPGVQPDRVAPHGRFGGSTIEVGFDDDDGPATVADAPIPAAPAKPSQTSQLLEALGLEVGSLIAGRYELRSVLGEGAMGSVLRVRDTELLEDVALKLILSHDQDELALERFRAEMRICRQLRHRAIVRTLEFGREGDLYYFTMELLDGIDLKSLLEQRGPEPLTEAQVLPWMIEACDALQVAHEAGVVHRDIKPSNLFLLRGGGIKILDFGAAKSDTSSRKSTLGGMLIGTPVYMSPERLSGTDQSARATDLWALGVVTYRLLTGHLPFPVQGLMKLLRAIASGRVDLPRKLNPDLSPATEQVLLKMLKPDPEARYQTIAEVRAALSSLL